jgi:hypothetical protein
MHRLSDPQQPPAGPFGKAAVREADGENADQNSPDRKWPAKLSEFPERQKKAQKIAAFAGRFRTGRSCPNSSEFPTHSPMRRSTSSKPL